MTSQILTIRPILEGVRAKNLETKLLFVYFSGASDSIHRGKMEQILLVLYIDLRPGRAVKIGSAPM